MRRWIISAAADVTTELHRRLDRVWRDYSREHERHPNAAHPERPLIVALSNLYSELTGSDVIGSEGGGIAWTADGPRSNVARTAGLVYRCDSRRAPPGEEDEEVIELSGGRSP